MRTPSRLMPKYKPQPFGVTGWLLLLVLAFGGLYILWIHPLITVLVVIAVIGLVVYEHVKEKLYFNRLLGQRQGESLSSFSREQDLKNVDTFIVRAAYEETQVELPVQNFPLRWSDNFYSDLNLQSDNVEDLIERIAQRTGRCLKNTELNPLFGKIYTVGDLIIFFNHQSKDYTDPNHQSEEN